jgi:tripartite-type tricarboxylate transporter receptor subunit TctC
LAQIHGRPLLLALCVAARAIDQFARLAEAYQPWAHYTRFPCGDKADDRNVIGAIRPTKPAPAQRRPAMAGRLALWALLLGGLLCAARAQSGAPDWPGTKPIHFEVVAAAGGLVDIVPRTLSNPLAASLGVPVVVENRPGAGGNVAAAVVAHAEPGGHTLLVTGSNLVANRTLLPNPGFDYERDLAPVSMLVRSKLLLVASPAFPANTITDVIALATQKPKSVSIAISPLGTPNHLAAEMLAQFGGADLNFVAYNGIAQALPDLIAGRVDLAVAAISVLLPQVRSGALKALAVTSPQRYPLAPDIPTAAEAGLAALQIDGWICAMVTGGTPEPIVARLDSEIGKALAAPEVRDPFAKQGIDIAHMNPNQLGAFLQVEAARFRSLLNNSRVSRAMP